MFVGCLGNRFSDFLNEQKLGKQSDFLWKTESRILDLVVHILAVFEPYEAITT